MATFYNRATLSYNNTSTDSNTVTGELLEVITAAKSALNENYRPGDTVTYLISLSNTGSTDIAGLTVTDNLGAYSLGAQNLTPLDYTPGSLRYYQNGVLQTAPTVTAGPPLTVSGITVPAGGNALLAYQATANTYAPLGAEAEIVNTATVTGNALANPITVTQTVGNNTAVALTISKSVCPATVTANEPITYTFVIQNYGNTATTAADAVAVTDTFAPVLKNLTATLNGATLTPTTDYTYDATTGQFQSVAGRIAVPAATYTQNAATGEWSISPGTAVLKITGTL